MLEGLIGGWFGYGYPPGFPVDLRCYNAALVEGWSARVGALKAAPLTKEARQLLLAEAYTTSPLSSALSGDGLARAQLEAKGYFERVGGTFDNLSVWRYTITPAGEEAARLVRREENAKIGVYEIDA